MIDEFLLNGLLAGLGIALISGPLGCFVVWRQMAYFGDSLAHSAFLGIGLGFLLGINLTLGNVLTCILFALFIVVLQERTNQNLKSDTLLGILSHAALSLGLVVIALLQNVKIDLLAYLFGDVLAVNELDLITVCAGIIIVLGALIINWRYLIACTLHEELARAEGAPVTRTRVIFTLLLAVTIAIGMKIIGILLITSLLIIPAATASRFARTPEQMAVIAAIIGSLGVIVGLFGSLPLDTPSGPTIVVAVFCMFLLSQIWQRRATKNR